MRNRKLKNEINVVPYIDVMLVLLVIFMVTAPMMTTSIVDLPSVNENAKQTPEQPPAPPIEVIIKDENTISVKNNKNNDEIIISDRKNSEELVNIINEFKIDENQAVVISGDKNVKYELVIDVMNILQQNDFKKIGLLVQNKQEKTSNKK